MLIPLWTDALIQTCNEDPNAEDGNQNQAGRKRRLLLNQKQRNPCINTEKPDGFQVADLLLPLGYDLR